MALVMPVSTEMNAGIGSLGRTSVWNSPSTSPPQTLTAPISVIEEPAGREPPVVSRSTTTNVVVAQRPAQLVERLLDRDTDSGPGGVSEALSASSRLLMSRTVEAATDETGPRRARARRPPRPRHRRRPTTNPTTTPTTAPRPPNDGGRPSSVAKHGSAGSASIDSRGSVRREGEVPVKGLKRLWLRVWGRVTKVGRRASSRTRAPRRAVAGAVRRMPLPAKLRQRLYQFVPWRPWTVEVPADRLLLGAQNSLSAAEFATRSDNLLWASTRVSDGPHAALLRQAAASPDLSDDEILEGPYGQFAHMVIRLTGNFFSARDDAGIVAVARDYIARSGDVESGGGTGDTTGRSLPRTEIRATPIKNSDCYQVIDGHHRVAAAVVRGRPRSSYDPPGCS